MKEIFDYLADLESLFETSKVYLTGGSVRNHLLGFAYDDYDIAIGLTPKEIVKRLEKSKIEFKTVFAKYGIVNIFLDNNEFTLASLRKESNYDDHRHPSIIEFVDSYIEDSYRRDFTINAIYMNSKKDILDPQEGVIDINNKVLKSIGNPKTRLEEDPLRILRAIRFKNIYNLKYEENLHKAIIENFNLIKELNPLKVKEELSKFNKDSLLEYERIKGDQHENY